GIDAAAGFEQPIPAELVDLMEQEMRQALGSLAPQFSQEDILEGLTEPTEQVIACTQAIVVLRGNLTSYWSECSTDADLRRAARDPEQALYASGSCRMQVVYRRDANQPLRFGPDELRRRVEIDWEPSPWPSQREPVAEPALELAVA